MDEHTSGAFEKLQKREHFLRVARNQMALGRITREVFKEKEAQILERYRLTAEEQRALDLYSKMIQQRKRK